VVDLRTVRWEWRGRNGFFLGLNLELRTSPKLKHRSGAENQQCLLNCTSAGFPPTKSDLLDCFGGHAQTKQTQGCFSPSGNSTNSATVTVLVLMLVLSLTQFRARSTTPKKSPLQIPILNPPAVFPIFTIGHLKHLRPPPSSLLFLPEIPPAITTLF